MIRAGHQVKKHAADALAADRERAHNVGQDLYETHAISVERHTYHTKHRSAEP